MKDQYEQYGGDDEPQYIGLGGRKPRMTKNQQIYGDFYEAYEKQDNMNIRPSMQNFTRSAYNNFKAGSTIQNYSAEAEVHIPQPKKKVKKTQEIQEEQQQPNVIGKFNLKSFLKQYQEKQQLQQIDQEDEQDSYHGPLCLNQKVKNKLRLIKIGEQSEDQEFDSANMNINQMTFDQYRRLVMNNKRKQQPKKKKLTAEEKEKEKQFIQSYGAGYKMLEKMGFNISKGLGKQEKGIQKPVEAVFKTAFTTKDTDIKDQTDKQQQSAKTEDQLPAEQQIFQYRSKNTKVNNFLLDLKNKFESLQSKIYFYQRQVQNFDRDFEINNSLKLQKQNQIQVHQDQIKKLKSILTYGKSMESINNGSKKEHIKNIYPHLSLQYKMDVMYVKNSYLKLKGMKDGDLYDKFPDLIRDMKQFLYGFYLEKEKETIKGYREGLKNLRDKNTKTINLQEEVIDLLDEGPTEQESIATVSIQDEQRIIKMIELVAENTVISKISEILSRYKTINEIKNYKILECIRSLKNLNKTSELVQRITNKNIKPLLLNYYHTFQYQQIQKLDSQTKSQKLEVKLQSTQSSGSKQQILPHLVIFPLFQVLQPKQMQIHRLFKVLSKKLWSIKSMTLYNIIKPLLQFCTEKQKNHFINFFLAPRMLYQLEQFDLSQPSICKELMNGFKAYKQFLNLQIRKDLLDNTIIPELVMTYKKYEQEGMPRMDLSQWLKRWAKQIGRIVPNYLEETLFNDFHIQI